MKLDELAQGASDERGRLCGVFPVGEDGVAEEFVHHPAGGFNGVPALPQPSADFQAEVIGDQLATQVRVAFDVHHEQPAHRVGANNHGGRRRGGGERRCGFAFKAKNKTLAHDIDEVAIFLAGPITACRVLQKVRRSTSPPPRGVREGWPSPMDDNFPTQRAPHDDGDAATVRAPKKEVVFSRYELQNELGKGGMGVVWLALDRELNSKVALKFLREEMTSEADALKELKGEVIINRDLSHPNIIKTFSFETNGRTSAISMEYVKGVNLHRLKKASEAEAKGYGVPAPNPAGFFEVEDIKQWVWQLCDAMDYAHRQKVVHRDIKPANLMLNERSELKVGDFGIGRTVADTVNRVTKNTAGTPPYMSPQQTMGEKAVPGDDIYSIGATIFDLLTGDPPFFRGAIRDQTLLKTPPTMTARRKELGRVGKPIPADWEKTVAACLAKEAADRPPTARAVREMFEGKFHFQPRAVARRPSKGRWAVAAGVLALAAAAAGATYWQLHRSPGGSVTGASAEAA